MKRFFLSLAVLSLAVICCLPVTARADFGGDYYYSLTEDGQAILEEYCGEAEKLVIPSTIEGYPVIGLGNWFLQNNDTVTSVRIPNSVTEFGTAFMRCTSLREVYLPQGCTTIPYYLFYCCSSLEYVYLPESVTTIENYAFYGCTNLSEINLPANLSSIGIGAFANCSSLTSITIPDSLTELGIAKGDLYPSHDYHLSYVYLGAFENCTSLTTVSLPDNLTQIVNQTFSGCTSLKTINMPSNLHSVGTCAFRNCTEIERVHFSSLVQLHSNAFSGCSKLDKVVLPKNLEEMGDHIFKNTALEKVVFDGYAAQWQKIYSPSSNPEINGIVTFNLVEDTSIISTDDYTGIYIFGGIALLIVVVIIFKKIRGY